MCWPLAQLIKCHRKFALKINFRLQATIVSCPLSRIAQCVTFWIILSDNVDMMRISKNLPPQIASAKFTRTGHHPTNLHTFIYFSPWLSASMVMARLSSVTLMMKIMLETMMISVLSLHQFHKETECQGTFTPVSAPTLGINIQYLA